jgi:wyosine [tRNA(Phe)-imidazoG37] synthetase (radical SAM superfamily)
MSYVFGPVPSRRLGRSLGVDPVPFKTCTYDCIYCQLGRTTNKTVQRREWVPLEDVVAELKEKLSSRPDYITLSGSGEPTLYSRIDELIGRVRSMTSIPTAVLTNASLLWQEEVRRQLMDAHLVILSLDAGDRLTFSVVNHPHSDVTFEQMLDGLVAFRNEYYGEYWLEVFLLAGYTSIPAETHKLADRVRRIKPDRVQLNTVSRPPAEDHAMAVDRQRLDELAVFFEPPGEVIAESRGVYGQSDFATSRESVIEMLQRRPCSIDDIADGLGMHRNEAVKYVEELSTDQRLQKRWSGGKLYLAAQKGERHSGS